MVLPQDSKRAPWVAGGLVALGLAVAVLILKNYECHRLSDTELQVEKIPVHSAAELDRLVGQLKGSCFPYVLQLQYLSANVSRWTAANTLTLAPEPWSVTVDTPIIALDADRRERNATEPSVELKLDQWLGMDQQTRSRYYARASSRRYESHYFRQRSGFGFGDDFSLFFGSHGADGTHTSPHSLFDFTVEERNKAAGTYVATLRLSGRGNAWKPHLDVSINHVLQLEGEKAWYLYHFSESRNLYLDTVMTARVVF